MYAEGFEKAVQDASVGEINVLPHQFGVVYPALELAFCGRKGDKERKVKSIPPATLILFARDGGIGFILAPKDADRNAHGFVGEPADLLTQIEAEIQEGRLGWKAPRDKRR